MIDSGHDNDPVHVRRAACVRQCLGPGPRGSGALSRLHASVRDQGLGHGDGRRLVVFSVTGSVPEIASCVRTFTSRFEGTSVQGLPIEPEQLLHQRLAAVDKLRHDGAMTEEEHSEQRKRILGEL